MGSISCKLCQKQIGTTSLPNDDDDYLCTPCYQSGELERALGIGAVAAHDMLSEAEIRKVVEKVFHRLRVDRSYGPTIDRIIEEHGRKISASS